MKWKNIPPISLIAIPYMVIAPILSGILMAPQIVNTQPWEMIAAHYIPVTLFILFPLSLILNVVWALFLRWDTPQLAGWNLRIKLWLIPVYLFVLVFAIGVPLAIPFLFVFDTLLLLTSSCYGLRATVRIRKARQLSSGMFLLLVLAHFCFVADVLTAVFLCRKLKSIPIAQNL